MANHPGQPKEKDWKTKRLRKVTRDRLRNIALYHLERYATSAENLKRVLGRRVLKTAQLHKTDMDQAREWIEDIVNGLVRAGAVDDTRFAEGKTTSMLRKGQSLAKVRAYLRNKGISQSVISNVMAAAASQSEDPDLKAARTYARKRGLGPYRVAKDSPERRNKELATLGRAGFRYETARKIVEANDKEALDRT